MTPTHARTQACIDEGALLTRRWLYGEEELDDDTIPGVGYLELASRRPEILAVVKAAGLE